MKHILTIISLCVFTTFAQAHEWTVTLTITKPIACNSGTGEAKVSWTELTAPVVIKLNGVEVGRDTQNGNGSFTITGVPAGTNAFTVTEEPVIAIPGNEPHARTLYETLAEPAAFAVANKAITQPSTGNTNGSITLSITGGTEPYTASWNTTPTQSGFTASNLSAGTYTLLVTDVNNCTFAHTEELREGGSAGVSNSKAPVLRIYPNPTTAQNNVVHIATPVTKNGWIHLYSTLGQLLRSWQISVGDSFELPLAGLSSGLYYIQMDNNATLYRGSLLVE